MKTKIIILVVICVLVAAIAGFWFRMTKSETPSSSNSLAQLAQCLKEKKAVFYGAFWCPHCQNQKRMFGAAASELPYVECSTSDGKGQLEICQQKNIQGYPTWEFADGSRLSGEIEINVLAQKTGCFQQ
ncbi:MAG: thioredoxin domain-containing protein [Patescibacteria group bacterium]